MSPPLKLIAAVVQKGITIRRGMNCIIAQTAIENDLVLLHDDADFDRLASVIPLKIYQVPHEPFSHR